MDKFQIVEVTEQFNHAGTKATADIADVAEKLGFDKLELCMRTTKEGYISKIQRQIGYYLDWNACYKKISVGSVVLLQHPFHYPQLTREKTLRKLKTKKHVKFISVVHDVEELRAFRFDDYYKREFNVMLELADAIVVHNEVMKGYFVEKGIPESKLINLEIFDYLQDKIEKKVSFERSITVAGNLDTTKCQYIGQLGELKDTIINLYGPNFNPNMQQYQNVEYHGSFPVNEIPLKLNAGFGLVWDGESIDGCKGLSGQYLRYNNPHKLSLYLSSGMPVVIWKDAAEAKFVQKYGVGICVDSLRDLDHLLSNIGEDEYGIFCKKVEYVRDKLITGFYAKKALELAIEITVRRV